jgi:RNA polymerase sigma-70 factor (ECF subfamily)
VATRADDVDIGRDRALVESFQAGDAAAFGQLYRTYYDRLERFCYRRLRDRSEAEEVAQEAFVRALRGMPTLGGERRFYPWVTVIASRLCVDTSRRLQRTTPADVIDLGSTDGGQDDIVDQVDLDLLRSALDRLDPRHREVLRLREQEGWSYQHIAEHFGITLGAVETLLFRARRALQRQFRALAGGSLAAIPLAGALARRFGGLRSRVASEVRPDLAPIVCNLSMAVAMVTAVAVGGVAMASSPAAATSPEAVGAIATQNGGSAQPVTTTTASTVAPGSAGTGSPATVVVRPVRVPGPTVAPHPLVAIVQPRVTNYGAEQQTAASAPIYVDVPGVGNVGANPDAVAQGVTTAVSTVAPVPSPPQLPSEKDTP